MTQSKCEQQHPLPATPQWLDSAGFTAEQASPTLHLNELRIAGGVENIGAVSLESTDSDKPRTPPWSALSAHIDEEVLRRLGRDLGGDEDVVREFAQSFVRQWDGRARRLAAALAESNRADTEVVLLSIRSSSTMLGARALEFESALMLGALAEPDLSDCRRHLPGLTGVGTRTCAELMEILAR